MKSDKIKAGFACFGEINTPIEIIKKKCGIAVKELESIGIDMVTTDPITDDPEGKDVARAIKDLSGDNFDCLILCVAGWIPSHAVISVTSEFSDKPMILWGLAGYMENERLVTTADQAGTTALRKVFSDLDYRFIYLYNIVGKPSPLDKIKSFALAASACESLRSSKVGMMGFRDMNLYNTLYDGPSLKKLLGTEIEFFEMYEMVQRSKEISDKSSEPVLKKIHENWDFDEPAEDDTLKKGINYYLSVKDIAAERGFQAISLIDVDGMKKLLSFPPAMIFMLLSDEQNLCTIPENDAMGAVTQLVVKALTGQCAAYLEFYEFFEKSILMGVPDFVPAEVVDGRVKVKPAAFGDISGGVLNISTMKTGRVTMVRLSNTGNQYSMHILTGEAKLLSWEEAGWDYPAPQLPSLEIFLDDPVEEFAQKVSGQHYILSYGDHSGTFRDFCYLKGIEIA